MCTLLLHWSCNAPVTSQLLSFLCFGVFWFRVLSLDLLFYFGNACFVCSLFPRSCLHATHWCHLSPDLLPSACQFVVCLFSVLLAFLDFCFLTHAFGLTPWFELCLSYLPSFG